MNPDTYDWLRVGHIVGFVLWIGGLLTVLQLLRVHGAVEGAARDVLARHERKMAVVMDAGSTLAIICGLWMALDREPTYFSAKTYGPWLHVKLTIVALVIIGMQVWTRTQIRKFRNGKVRPISPVLTYVVLAAAAAIIMLGAHHGLLRKGG